MKNDNLALMAIVHQDYDDLMAQGAVIVKAFLGEIEKEGHRKGTLRVSNTKYQIDFTCFSIPLRLRIEFDIPRPSNTQDREDKAWLGSAGEISLYRIGTSNGDETLQPFHFVQDRLATTTHKFTYMTGKGDGGFVIAYKAVNEMRAKSLLADPNQMHTAFHTELMEFVPYYLDTLESFIAKSGIRVIPE